MIKVDVIVQNNKWKNLLKRPAYYFKRKVLALNKKEKFIKEKKISFSLMLAGDVEIRKLNKKFRNKNKITDVLSFPSHQKRILKNLFKKKKEIYIGDIILNFNKIKKNKFKLSFIDMLDKLWIHGFLHLLGYTHKKDSDFKIMLKQEEKYLKAIKSINVK